MAVRTYETMKRYTYNNGNFANVCRVRLQGTNLRNNKR